MKGIRTDEERRRDRLQTRNIRKASKGTREARSAIHAALLNAREWRRLMRCAASDGRKSLATERRWAAEALYRIAYQLGDAVPNGAGLFKAAGPFANAERQVAA